MTNDFQAIKSACERMGLRRIEGMKYPGRKEWAMQVEMDGRSVIWMGCGPDGDCGYVCFKFDSEGRMDDHEIII